jgi:hypothetical protein
LGRAITKGINMPLTLQPYVMVKWTLTFSSGKTNPPFVAAIEKSDFALVQDI